MISWDNSKLIYTYFVLELHCHNVSFSVIICLSEVLEGKCWNWVFDMNISMGFSATLVVVVAGLIFCLKAYHEYDNLVYSTSKTKLNRKRNEATKWVTYYEQYKTPSKKKKKLQVTWSSPTLDMTDSHFVLYTIKTGLYSNNYFIYFIWYILKVKWCIF